MIWGFDGIFLAVVAIREHTVVRLKMNAIWRTFRSTASYSISFLFRRFLAGWWLVYSVSRILVSGWPGVSLSFVRRVTR